MAEETTVTEPTVNQEQQPEKVVTETEQPESQETEKTDSEIIKEVVDDAEEDIDVFLSKKPEDVKKELAESKVVETAYKDLKVPDGMELDTNFLSKVEPIFKKHNISKDVVQEIVDVYAPYIKEQAEQQTNRLNKGFKDIVKEWGEELKVNYGSDFEKNLSVASKAIDKFGTPELREFFKHTGVGNNINLVNFLVNVGKMISTDSFVEPKKETKIDTKDFSLLYPSMKK